MSATLPTAESAEIKAYISDMLSQLADLACGIGEVALERAIRLTAVQAAAASRPKASQPALRDEAQG